MNYNLARYQVYLDPNDIQLLDRISRKLKIKRSQIIREATHAVASRYAHITRLMVDSPTKTSPLTSLIGIEISRTGNIGLNIDEIYQHV